MSFIIARQAIRRRCLRAGSRRAPHRARAGALAQPAGAPTTNHGEHAPSHAGFPPLIASLSCSRPRPGAPGRPDVTDIIKLLLSFGADPNQRGVNDYTSLHMAVSERNLPAVEILLEAGADPRLRTRIDDCETPREMAEQVGLREMAELLATHEARRAPG